MSEKDKAQILKGLKERIKRASMMGFLVVLAIVLGVVCAVAGVSMLICFFSCLFSGAITCLIICLVSGTLSWLVAEVADYVNEVLLYGPRWP